MSEIAQHIYDSAVFCAFHEQLASLGRHAQLTRCFSAVAELLVVYDLTVTGFVTHVDETELTA